MIQQTFNPLEEALKNIEKAMQLKHTNIIIINFLTILRSIINTIPKDTNVTIDYLIELIQQNYSMIAEYVVKAVSKYNLVNLEKFSLLIYATDYEVIPDTFVRRNKNTRNLIELQYNIIFNDQSAILDEYLSSTISNICSMLGLPDLFHAAYSNVSGSLNFGGHMYDIYSMYYTLIKEYNFPKYWEAIMINHMPIDYHLPFKSFQLIDTHTGNIWDEYSIGNKVFKIPFIPFNKLTHCLFGDKHFIKPLLTPKIKKELLESIIRSNSHIWNNDMFVKWLMVKGQKDIINKLKIFSNLF